MGQIAKFLLKKILKKCHRKFVTDQNKFYSRNMKVSLCIKQKKCLSVLDKKVSLCIRQKILYIFVVLRLEHPMGEIKSAEG